MLGLGTDGYANLGMKREPSRPTGGSNFLDCVDPRTGYDID